MKRNRRLSKLDNAGKRQANDGTHVTDYGFNGILPDIPYKVLITLHQPNQKISTIRFN